MKKERYISALRKRVYALVEQGVITAGAGSVIMTCADKRYERLVYGFSVEKLPRPRRDIECFTCNQCGWVYFGVSLEKAKTEVESFNNYFATLTSEKQTKSYGGKKSSIESYKKCDRCGNSYKNFRRSGPSDCPSGCTVNPILNPNA
jgi:hypothetical protein